MKGGVNFQNEIPNNEINIKLYTVNGGSARLKLNIDVELTDSCINYYHDLMQFIFIKAKEDSRKGDPILGTDDTKNHDNLFISF